MKGIPKNLATTVGKRLKEKNPPKRKVTIVVTTEVYAKFESVCDKMGFFPSQVIDELMRTFIEKN